MSLKRILITVAALAAAFTPLPAHAATPVAGPFTQRYTLGGAGYTYVDMGDPTGSSPDGQVHVGGMTFPAAGQPFSVLKATADDDVSPFVAITICQDRNHSGVCGDEVPAAYPSEVIASTCLVRGASYQISTAFSDDPVTVFVQTADACLNFFYFVPFVFPSGAGAATKGTVTLTYLDQFDF
jgi:hypothetical protein